MIKAQTIYLTFVGLFFVLPKMLGLADWSWFIVLAPLWIPVVSVAITAITIFALLFFWELVDE